MNSIVVHHQHIPIGIVTTIEAPYLKPLFFGLRKGLTTLWYQRRVDEPTWRAPTWGDKRDFMVLATGEELEIPENHFADYVGTTQAENGHVWHCYEVAEAPF